MKGFAPVINVLIIVAVSVIVLTSVIAFYYPSFSSESEVVSLEYVKVSACQALTAEYCNKGTINIQTVGFDADKDGIVGESAADGDNLFMLCYNYYQIRCDQMAGDINEDCILDPDDVATFFTVCEPWIDICPPPSPPPTMCDIGPPCGTPNGCVDSADISCIVSMRGTTETGAEMNCKRLCGC